MSKTAYRFRLCGVGKHRIELCWDYNIPEQVGVIAMIVVSLVASTAASHTYPKKARTMPRSDIPTKWNGLIIRYDPQLEPYFALTVKEQLDIIASKPVGNSLLKGIANCRLPPKFGYRVCIMRASNEFDLTENIAWKRAKGSNTTFGSDMTRACMSGAGVPGQGTVSAIKYNPNAYDTPDGRRAPWVGLAHELIHAYNNAYGLSLQDRTKDEAKTTGLLAYEDAPITENKIRAEHNIAKRTTYYQLIGHQDHLTGRVRSASV